MAGPTTQCLPFSALSRCRDFLTRLGGGPGMTGRLMAAPHLGQSAVPGDTSIRQREQAGKSATLLPAITDVSAQATAEGVTTCPGASPGGIRLRFTDDRNPGPVSGGVERIRFRRQGRSQ